MDAIKEDYPYTLNYQIVKTNYTKKITHMFLGQIDFMFTIDEDTFITKEIMELKFGNIDK